MTQNGLSRLHLARQRTVVRLEESVCCVKLDRGIILSFLLHTLFIVEVFTTVLNKSQEVI